MAGWLPKSKRAPLESNVQGKVIKQWRKAGWKCIKVETPTENGWPDYQCMKPGVILWIEFKKKHKEPTPQQYLRHQEIMDCGFLVFVIDTYEDGMDLLNNHDDAMRYLSSGTL